jgi:hypothetical protein
MSYKVVNNKYRLTNDLCNTNVDYNNNTIQNYCTEYKSIEEASDFLKTFKMKWESHSNNTINEIRDEKINSILN